jgi:hypothetical protein
VKDTEDNSLFVNVDGKIVLLFEETGEVHIYTDVLKELGMTVNIEKEFSARTLRWNGSGVSARA